MGRAGNGTKERVVLEKLSKEESYREKKTFR